MFFCMLIESGSTSLHRWFVHSADITEILFILITCTILLLQRRERINHNTSDNVLEHHLHEDNIDNIKSKSGWSEFIHIFTNSTLSVKL